MSLSQLTKQTQSRSVPKRNCSVQRQDPRRACSVQWQDFTEMIDVKLVIAKATCS